MSKYTPGPWNILKAWDGRSYEVNSDNGTPVTIVPDARLNAEANARLIAAAPELLSAAHATLKLWKKHGMGDNHHESDRIFDMLTAAIAKAEGK